MLFHARLFDATGTSNVKVRFKKICSASLVRLEHLAAFKISDRWVFGYDCIVSGALSCALFFPLQHVCGAENATWNQVYDVLSPPNLSGFFIICHSEVADGILILAPIELVANYESATAATM